MSNRTLDSDALLAKAAPIVHQHAHESQPYGRLVKLPIALSESACVESIANLNQLLADSIVLRDLYKKHHWQLAGPTFYQLHLLFDRHAGEQNELVDLIAERIQLLGGVSVAMAHDVGRIDARPETAQGARGSPGSNLPAAARARDRAHGSALDGSARGRGWRRWDQRLDRRQRHSTERTAGMVRRRARRRHAIGAREIALAC